MMTIIVVCVASAALVYFVGLPIVKLIHEGKEMDREGRHD